MQPNALSRIDWRMSAGHQSIKDEWVETVRVRMDPTDPMELSLIAFVTYVATCEFYLQWDMTEGPLQKYIAYRRSIQNFVLLFLVCMAGCVPPIPVTSACLLPFFSWILLSEMFFAASHRLLHTKHVYWIHKQHHENNPSFSTSCFDAHPIEFFIGNMVVATLPMYMVPGALTAQGAWAAFATVNTVLAHESDDAHQTHHKYFACNYSQGTYLLDRWFGTYREKCGL